MSIYFLSFLIPSSPSSVANPPNFTFDLTSALSFFPTNSFVYHDNIFHAQHFAPNIDFFFMMRLMVHLNLIKFQMFLLLVLLNLFYLKMSTMYLNQILFPSQTSLLNLYSNPSLTVVPLEVPSVGPVIPFATHPAVQPDAQPQPIAQPQPDAQSQPVM